MNAEELYRMQLNESKIINPIMTVTRVPGGWVYNNAFVPWDNEFQPESGIPEYYPNQNK